MTKWHDDYTLRLNPKDIQEIVERVCERITPMLEKFRDDAGEPDRWLCVNEVCKILGVSRNAIYKRINAGTFPKPVLFGDRKKWKLTTIERVMRKGVV